MKEEKKDKIVQVAAEDYRDLITLVTNTKRITKVVLEDVVKEQKSDDCIADVSECFSLLHNLYETLMEPLTDEKGLIQLFLEIKKQKIRKEKTGSKDEVGISINQDRLFEIKTSIAAVTMLRQKIRDDHGINMQIH